MDTKPLVTLAEACAFLEIRVGTKDEYVKRLIAMATADIESATGRFFARQEYTEYLTTRDNQRTDYDFWGSDVYTQPTVMLGGMKTIVSPQTLPLKGVNVDPATVQCWYAPYATGPDSFTDDTTLTGTEFQIDTDDDRLVIYRATRFRMRALKVTYTAGYEAAPTDGVPDEVTLSASIPDWLKSAALVQCQFLKIKLRPDNIGMAAERTTSEKGKVSSSAFLAVSGLTTEAVGYVRHLKRVGTGRG